MRRLNLIPNFRNCLIPTAGSLAHTAICCFRVRPMRRQVALQPAISPHLRNPRRMRRARGRLSRVTGTCPRPFTVRPAFEQCRPCAAPFGGRRVKPDAFGPFHGKAVRFAIAASRPDTARRRAGAIAGGKPNGDVPGGPVSCHAWLARRSIRSAIRRRRDTGCRAPDFAGAIVHRHDNSHGVSEIDDDAGRSFNRPGMEPYAYLNE